MYYPIVSKKKKNVSIRNLSSGSFSFTPADSFNNYFLAVAENN
jgi:hypothetical protein